jgi:hypothetical protein
MKKYILFSVLAVISLTVFGQKHGGSKDQYGYGGISLSASNTWLLNKFVFDKGDEQDIAASFGGGFGFVAGYNFNKSLGAEININFNTHNMKYTGDIGTTANPYEYKSKTKLKYIDIPILFKAGGETYFEFGPEFSFLSKAEYSFKSDNVDSTMSVKSDFSGSSFNIVFGFGHNFEIDKQFAINAGFRLMYGLSDIKGVDGLGASKSDYPTTTKGIDDFKTNLTAMYIHVGCIYKIK